MSAVTILGPVGSSVIELPFFSSRVSAGFPSPAQDHMEQTLSLDELLDIDAPHTYLVRADGDSMTGAGILDGDVLVVSRALTGRSCGGAGAVEKPRTLGFMTGSIRGVRRTQRVQIVPLNY